VKNILNTVHRHPVASFVSGSLAVLATSLGGCGSPRIEEGRVDLPARATASADPRQRTIRPIPDVTTKPRPFRLPDVVGAVPSLEPATMDRKIAPPVIAQVAATRVEKCGNEPPRTLPAETPAVAEVTAMIRDYLQAFNRHDSAALAAHWSEHGENVDLDSGETTRGRAAVEQVFSTLFEEDAAATVDIEIESVRGLRDDVAVVDGLTRISFSEPAGRRGSRFSAVVVKEDGRWMLESVREAAVPQPADAGRPLDDLQWLVGSWEDVGEGLTAGTTCSWSAGRSFLIRNHVVTADAVGLARVPAGDTSIPDLLPPGSGGSREISEIIGWDPERRQIRSWLFTSEGRFAEGWWTREGDRYRVRLEGRGADESAACTYLLDRIGSDELSIRCEPGGSADPLADLMPPACGFVRISRLEPGMP